MTIPRSPASPRSVDPTRRGALLALGSLAALSLSACASLGGAEFDEPTAAGGTTDGPSDEATQPASDAGGQSQDTDSSANSDGTNASGDASGQMESAETIDPADAVATVSYALPSGEVDGTMTVGLHHLRLRGESMELLLTFTPEFTGDGAYTLWQLHGGNHAVVSPSLVDRAHLTRYDILRTTGTWDTEGVWNSPQGEIELASGETQAYWANFAAPVDEIDVVDVALPAGATFEDVPIESAGEEG
ncbi:hypothetical protein ACXET9_15420 [Brachybacterium sp. DNPG3]